MKIRYKSTFFNCKTPGTPTSPTFSDEISSNILPEKFIFNPIFQPEQLEQE